MGYLFRKLNGKRSWKVQYRTYKGGRHAKDIREDDYFRLGFHSGMDRETARQRCNQLNAKEALKNLQEKRDRISEKLREHELVINSHFPVVLLEEFEENFLSGKKVFHWRTSKKLIIKIKLDSSDWAFYRARWYKLFKDNSYSIDYIKKLTHVLNQWGKFVAYKQKSFFEPLPSPAGIDKQHLISSYENKGSTKESEAITIDQLQKIQAFITEEQYNWLYISVWFGLRPSEVDLLLKPSGPKTWVLKNNCLWVYQSKLTGIATKDRIKPIPIKYPEQQAGIQILYLRLFKRPLNKTLKKYFGTQTTCYGGRKGFVDLMLSKGNSLEAISQWLGHRSLDRTWRHYKDKKVVLSD